MSTTAQAPKVIRLNAATTLTVGPSKSAPGSIDLTIQRGFFTATERVEVAAALKLSMALSSVAETVADCHCPTCMRGLGPCDGR